MVSFEVKNADLINLIKRAIAKGVITVTSTEKVTKNFFRNFYLEAKNEDDIGILEIKAIDSEEGRMFQWSKISGIQVEKEGKFAVTDSKMLLDLLGSIPSKRTIEFSYEDGKPLIVATSDEGTFKGFEIRGEFTMPEDNIKAYESAVLKFIGAHSFNEDGHPQIVDGEGNQHPYATLVEFSKEELGGVVSQTVNLTRDEDIVVKMTKEGDILFRSGKKNSEIKSKDLFEKRVQSPIEFEQMVGNLQPILPHLFGKIKMFLRKAGSGSVKYWIQSKSGNIELNFASGMNQIG
jgi:hypothetical protein